MIKEGIEKILSLAPVQQLTIDGREYTDQAIYPVKAPLPDALKVHTLTGIVDYIKTNAEDGDSILAESSFLQVCSPVGVRLLSGLFGAFKQRKQFIVAVTPDRREYPFHQWLNAETFNIELQAKFVQDDNTKALLAFVASIHEGEVRTSKDDGYSQEVTAKAGVTLVTGAKVPNPVILRPYRTFMEVTQPAISCVFRVRKGPELSLHEADGGEWRLFAISAIRDYLRDAMDTLGQKIPVIA